MEVSGDCPLLASFYRPSGDSISIKLGEVFRGGAAEVGLLERTRGGALCSPTF